MSPRKLLNGYHKQVKAGSVINGPRPTPLKLKQGSVTIKKHHEPIRRPVIIYMRSPKVIHTKPNDFMALVQKLTGQYSTSEDQEQQKKKKTLKQEDGYDRNDNESSNDYCVTHEKDGTMKAKSPMFNMPSNHNYGDIPLFTPNLSDFFYSPRRFYRFSDVVSSSPNISTNSLSPGSIVEILKGLPES